MYFAASIAVDAMIMRYKFLASMWGAASPKKLKLIDIILPTGVIMGGTRNDRMEEISKVAVLLIKWTVIDAEVDNYQLAYEFGLPNL